MPIALIEQSDLAPLIARLEALEGATQASTAGIAAKIWHANSGNSSELVTQLPEGAVKKVVFSIALPALAVGDLVEAHASFEVTNPYAFNIMVGRQLRIADAASAVNGIELSEAATRNISPNMHHDHIQDFGSYVVTDAMVGRFVNFIAYTGSTAYSSGDAAVVEQDYGRLFVKVYPAAMVL